VIKRYNIFRLGSKIKTSFTKMVFIRRWEPFREFIERFFEEDFDFSISPRLATDVYETDKDLVVEMQVPGFKKEDIKVSFQDDYLKVEGKAEEEKEEKDKNYWRKEIRRGSFVRVIPLPKKVDPKKAKASFKDGILKISLPKIEEIKEAGEEIKIE
jgi:HSP20 family protein